MALSGAPAPVEGLAFALPLGSPLLQEVVGHCGGTVDRSELGEREAESDTRVHIATVQAMLQRLLLGSEVDKPAVDTYDLIVVDECHRGYLLDREPRFEAEAFNRQVITEPFNRVVCEVLANELDPLSPHKTLNFCATDAHADLVVILLKEAVWEAAA